MTDATEAAARSAYFGNGLLLSFVVSPVVFTLVWLAAISAWGWLLGLAFGWIPALLIGLMAGGVMIVAWPLVVIGGLVMLMNLAWGFV